METPDITPDFIDNRPLAKINYGTVGGFKNLRSISIRHPNEVTKVLCIDYDMDFL
ncbi:hypothetical protein [Nostoc sp.]|uniref:hypothetical protein n=1 Tax=Nostoc sp. TaxID=1180 RepID=UPI002FF6E798